MVDIGSDVSRSRRQHEVVIVGRQFVSDSSISLAAKGLLLWLLAMPDNWKAKLSDVIETAKATEQEVLACIAELQAARYVVEQGGKMVAFDEPQAIEADSEKADPEPDPEPETQEQVAWKDMSKQARAKTVKGLHQSFVDDYWSFYKSMNDGLEPSWKGSEGSKEGDAAKKIIEYFLRITGEAKDGVSHIDRAQNGWQLMFECWLEVEQFYQKQYKLCQILSNLTNIMPQIKKAASAEPATQPASAGTQRTVDAGRPVRSWDKKQGS